MGFYRSLWRTGHQSGYCTEGWQRQKYQHYGCVIAREIEKKAEGQRPESRECDLAGSGDSLDASQVGTSIVVREDDRIDCHCHATAQA